MSTEPHDFGLVKLGGGNLHAVVARELTRVRTAVERGEHEVLTATDGVREYRK